MKYIYVVMYYDECLASFLSSEDAEKYAELRFPEEDAPYQIAWVPLWNCKGEDAYRIENEVDKYIYDKRINTEERFDKICEKASELRQKLLAEVMK